MNANTRTPAEHGSNELERLMLGAVTAVFTGSERRDYGATYDALCEADEDYPDDIQPWCYFEALNPSELACQIESEADFLTVVTSKMLEQVQASLAQRGVDLKGINLIELVDASAAPWHGLDEQ